MEKFKFKIEKKPVVSEKRRAWEFLLRDRNNGL